MHTQRTIMLIVLVVALAGLAIASGLVWWLGFLIGGAVVLGGAVALIALYLAVVQPWHSRWGATDEEVARTMPGDDLIPDATSSSTRAVTIEAAPRDIWPWLVQIGYGKAGWYSYDWIDNDGEPSADRIVPEHQDVEVGDLIAMMPGFGPSIVSIEPNQALVSAAEDGSSSWCLGLYPSSDGTTRLVSRWRASWNVTPSTAFFIVLSDPGAFIMEQKMLREIRKRVEGTSAPQGRLAI